MYTDIENTGTKNPAWIKNHQNDIKSAKVVDEDIKPKSTCSWFCYLEKITSCDLLNLNTSQVTNMSFMFYGCFSLTNLDLSNFDTSQVTNMSAMFGRCSHLKSLDLSNFNTSQVTYMNSMFGCPYLQQITFGANWNWVGTDSYLPTPDSTYIDGADGNWYDMSGTAYVPNEIPSNTAMTYFASKNLVPAIEEKAFAD